MGDRSNLSREFRALVTQIRGPLEEELADRSASAARRERLKTLQRSFMRLLQLVNTLFDVEQDGPARRNSSDLVDAGAETLVIPRLRDSDAAISGESPEHSEDTDELCCHPRSER
jgi:signal transduction histidine kinase